MRVKQDRENNSLYCSYHNNNNRLVDVINGGNGRGNKDSDNENNNSYPKILPLFVLWISQVVTVTAIVSVWWEKKLNFS